MATILVVDDDADVRDSIRRVLEAARHEVTVEGNGRDALETLRSETFDLIVTDIYMPDMDGVEFMIRLGQRGVSTPIVVVTGGGWEAADDLLERVGSLGARAALAKPFDLEELQAVVHRVLEETGG